MYTNDNNTFRLLKVKLDGKLTSSSLEEKIYKRALVEVLQL